MVSPTVSRVAALRGGRRRCPTCRRSRQERSSGCSSATSCSTPGYWAERVEPREPRVVEDEPEEYAAAFHTTLFAFVPDARVIEQRLVHAQESAPNVLELTAELLGQRSRTGGRYGRARHWHVGR